MENICVPFLVYKQRNNLNTDAWTGTGVLLPCQESKPGHAAVSLLSETSSLMYLRGAELLDDCLAAPTEGAESLSETTDVSVKLRQKALWRNGREREREKQAQSRPWSVWKPMLRDLLQHVTITETQQMHRLNCGSGGGVFLLSLLYAYSTYADVSLPLCKSSICPSNLFLFPFRSKPQHYKTYLMFKNEMKIQNC